MSTQRALSKLALTLSFLIAVQAAHPVVAEHLLARIDRLVQQATYHGTEPASGMDGAVEMLAENIDWLEHHIDTYGSVVAKSPDIWGEARLTKFRDEYEKIMFRELTGFDVKINASLTQSDNSFLAQALALSAAASGTTPALASTTASDTADASVQAGIVKATLVDAESALIPPTGTEGVFGRFGIEGDEKISLEPVLELDQHSRYLNHLHELRRINEGDDTSDSPGYSLNLVRIPVSILPGKITRTGFGAEVTVTCTPVITDDLMPTTFHNLAVNDMVDLLGLPLVRVTESMPQLEKGLAAAVARRLFISTKARIDEIIRTYGEAQYNLAIDQMVPFLRTILANETAVERFSAALEVAKERAQRSSTDEIATALTPVELRTIGRMPATSAMSSLEMARHAYSDLPPVQEAPAVGSYLRIQTKADGSLERRKTKIDSKEVANEIEALQTAVKNRDPRATAVALYNFRGASADQLAQLNIVVSATLTSLKVGADQVATVIPSGRSRRALNPLNPTTVAPVIGIENLAVISRSFDGAYYGRYIRWNGGPGPNCDPRVDLLDAQRFLQAELEAAHQLLSQPENVRLFTAFAAPCSGLANQIRTGHLTESCPPAHSVEEYRHCFFEKLHECCPIEAASTEEGLRMPASVCNYAPESLPTPSAAGGNESSGTHECYTSSGDLEARNTVEALAWALVVESALLNERLNLDVRKVAKSKEAYQLETSRDYLFFLPETVMAPNSGLEDLQGEFQEATDIFKEYVKVRWPIHVFAVDPREQDQNVADVSARKRELQFALALGFVTGQIGVNSLTQYSRELQTQIETIALNRTVVGFGHGDDTFGWRFQPRVQGLYVPNTLGAIRETICGVSRDYDLRHRQLEPGQRDCTAIVLMPSFVPYADFDVRTNWYKLTNPKNAALTMKETVRLSRAITAMRQSQSQCMECAEFYRDNEVGRLLKRVDQLDRELPLQTMRVLVPYENTLGGFEMFNTGVTDLSPELIGWYGAPGVMISDKGCNQFKCGCTATCAAGGLAPLVEECQKQGDANVFVEVAKTLPICEGEGTTLFLVGDNFSVHDTKVIAGGVCIPHVQLVSRQIMRVTIPSCVQTVSLCEHGQTNDYVALYVATPYGVTNHLHVPVNTQISAESKSQIEQAVATQVQAAVAKLELPPRHLAIAPALQQDNTIFLTAECRTPACTSFDCQLAPRSALEVRYTFQGDPRFNGKAVTFSAVPFLGGKFLGGLTEVAGFATLRSGENFPAMGNGQATLLQDIGNGLRLEDFKDGKAKLKLVYYARIDGQQVPERLLAEIAVEVTLHNGDANSPTAFLPANPSRSVALQWQQTGVEVNSVPPAPMPLPHAAGLESAPIEPGPALESPAAAPSAAEAAGDCPCGQIPAASAVQLATVNLTAAPRRVPVQLAQFQSPELLPGIDTQQLVPLNQDTNSQLLAEIAALKEQVAAQQAAIQAALEHDGESFPSSNAALAGQSIINVNIQQPGGHCAWLCDQLECPIAHRFYVRGRECWRNVRDQIPCN